MNSFPVVYQSTSRSQALVARLFRFQPDFPYIKKIISSAIFMSDAVPDYNSLSKINSGLLFYFQYGFSCTLQQSAVGRFVRLVKVFNCTNSVCSADKNRSACINKLPMRPTAYAFSLLINALSKCCKQHMANHAIHLMIFIFCSSNISYICFLVGMMKNKKRAQQAV